MAGDRVDEGLGSAARAALDSLLTPAGFTSGQGGSAPSDQVIFCIGYRDFIERYPAVRPPFDYEGHPSFEVACLDLIIEGSEGRGITDVRFEGAHLDDLLRRAGHPDEADAASSWPGSTVAGDLVRVRSAMATLLDLPAGFT